MEGLTIENKNIIMILIGIIIVILIGGLVVLMPTINKDDCKMTIQDNEVYVGDHLTAVLEDENKNDISNETIHFKLVSGDGTKIEKDVVTNSKGKAKIKMSDAGDYAVECTFDGNDLLKACSVSENVSVNEATTSVIDSGGTGTSQSSNTIKVVSVADRTVKKVLGEYTLEVTRWSGSSFGGFGVMLYKNGKLMDRYSYESRAYFCDDTGQWKWSNWDSGEVDAVYHKYHVSNDFEIRDVEVRF